MSNKFIRGTDNQTKIKAGSANLFLVGDEGKVQVSSGQDFGVSIKGDTSVTGKLSSTGDATISGATTLSTLAVTGAATFKNEITVGAFLPSRLNISSTQTNTIVTIPTTTANSDIGLPVIAASLKGFKVTLICAADSGAHTITIRQGGASDGTGTLADTPIFGILMDDGANSLSGTTSAVIGASKFKKGDHIEIVCDGTNYIIRAQMVTAGAMTVS
tara:strand:+ start:256 stop:903 length:648 start_codon:yes stop_codon:yes gene_type:complete